MKRSEWTRAFRDIPKVPLEDTKTVHVLLGDWNVRLGEQTGDTRTNGRANHFNQRLLSNRLTLLPFTSSSPTSSPTSTFLNKHLRASVPDFILVSAAHLNSCSAVTVLEDNGGSDHFPIMVDMFNEDDDVEQHSVQNPRKIAVHLLEKNMRIRQAYSEEVNASLRIVQCQYQRNWCAIQNSPGSRVSTVQKLLDDLVTSFHSILLTSLEKHCKHRTKRYDLSKFTFPDDKVLADLREQRVIMLRLLRTYRSVNDVRVLMRSQLNQVNRAFVKRVKALQKQRERVFFDILETKAIGEQQRMIKFEKNSNQRPGTKMLHPESLPQYSAHFASIFDSRTEFVDHEPPTATSATDSENELAGIIGKTGLARVKHFFSIPIMQHFVMQAPNGKAAGCSGVSAESMKPVAPVVASILSLVAEVMYCTGLCPEVFKRANITPIPKKSNSSNIKDFRPISLTEVSRKIIEKCLALLLKPFERRLSPMQGGFREQRSTLDQAAVLQQVLTARYKDRKSTVVAFLDIKAAYDSVDRHMLWICCKRAGIPDPVVRMLCSMFDHNSSRVVIDGFEGEWFPNSVGLMQGSSLSPFLYALFIDDLPKGLLDPDFASIPLGDSKVNSILYADDIALMTESVDEMQIILNYCTKFAQERHFRWGTRKCEILLSRIPVPSSPLMLQNAPLSVSKSFKYLGIFFNEKGIDTDACVDRLGKSIDKAAGALFAIGLEPHNYPLHIIANHFRVFVRSCGEYALAILPLTKAQLDTLESHQYRAIRRLLKSNTRVSRIKLLTCLGLETVTLRYNVLSAKWFDRVQHLKGTNFLVKQAWIDFSQRPKQLSQSSSFYYPAKKNPLITNFYNYCTSSSAIEPTSAIDSLLAIDSVHSAIESVLANESAHANEPVSTNEPVPTIEPVSVIQPVPRPRISTRPRTIVHNYQTGLRQRTIPAIEFPSVIQLTHRQHSLPAFCRSFRAICYSRIMNDNLLPVPRSTFTIVKTLHMLGIPRGKLRFPLMWITNCVPHAACECAKCKGRITKAHLESCVVRSPLPRSEPGNGIDNLFHRALTQMHAPSAILAVDILYNEVTLAFPSPRSL